MSEEVKHSLIWATVIIVAATSIPWSLSSYFTSVSKAAIEAGLEQRTLPGAGGVYWVKPEGK